MGIVIDFTTRLPVDLSNRDWGIRVDFDAPKQERLIFDTQPLPKRMIRIAATVPSECLGLLGDAWRKALLDAGVVKRKPERRRASK